MARAISWEKVRISKSIGAITTIFFAAPKLLKMVLVQNGFVAKEKIAAFMSLGQEKFSAGAMKRKGH